MVYNSPEIHFREGVGSDIWKKSGTFAGDIHNAAIQKAFEKITAT